MQHPCGFLEHRNVTTGVGGCCLVTCGRGMDEEVAMLETLAQIEAPARGNREGFTAGIVQWGEGPERDLDKVVEASPIVRTALKGKRRDYVRAYCAKRGWRVSVVHQLERPHPWAPKATGDAL